MEEAVIDAGAVRLRPILMTTITTVLGMMPLALGLGEGSEMMQPLAIAVVGGLTVSTLLTLFVVPERLRDLQPRRGAAAGLAHGPAVAARGSGRGRARGRGGAPRGCRGGRLTRL